MKKYFLPVFVFLFSVSLLAQNDEGYKFTMVKQLPATSVKNQSATNTCYTFAPVSMLESELIRMGKGEFDLSEMQMVYNFYIGKADKYIRMHGGFNFPEGGAADNVINYISKAGLVPEEVYHGINYGSENHNHMELYQVINNYIQTISNKGQKVSSMWKKGLEAILEAWLGKYPASFTYKGKNYTPQSFAKELGINPDDYVILGSYTHHDYYSKFVLEVPDNWEAGSVYNVPLDDMEKIIDNAIMQGYTVVWSTDMGGGQAVSNNGVYVVPEQDLTKMKREEIPALFKKPIPEKIITPEIRQTAFDNFQTTDDHAMHLIGIAKDQDGKKFYYVKNSWGTGGKYQGYLYASAPFVRLSTTTILLNKKGIPEDILKKLNIK